jgi:DNA-binding MarR family transcriptional regulator
MLAHANKAGKLRFMESKTASRPRLSDEHDPRLEAWRSFVLAHSRLMRALDEDLQQEHDFTIGEFDVLINLSRIPEGLRMCDLAAAVVLSPSGLTRRIDRLERAGLVERTRAEGDARNVVSKLTPAGRRLFKRLRDTHVNGIEERFLSHFSDDEIETLGELLGRLVPRDDPPSPR